MRRVHALRSIVAFAVAATLATGCDVGSLELESADDTGRPDSPDSLPGDDAPTAPDDPDGDMPPGDPTALACDACHGSDGNSAPPSDLDGNTDRALPTVGAHREHLAASDWRAAIACTSCHVVPSELSSPGHLDGDGVAELTFDALNPVATYDATTASCANLYCHGDGRGDNGSLAWTGDPTLDCQSCHGAGRNQGLSASHDEHFGEGIGCVDCHQQVVGPGLDIIAAALHIDGQRQVAIATGGTYDPANGTCTNLACHGAERW